MNFLDLSRQLVYQHEAGERINERIVALRYDANTSARACEDICTKLHPVLEQLGDTELVHAHGYAFWYEAPIDLVRYAKLHHWSEVAEIEDPDEEPEPVKEAIDKADEAFPDDYHIVYCVKCRNTMLLNSLDWQKVHRNTCERCGSGGWFSFGIGHDDPPFCSFDECDQLQAVGSVFCTTHQAEHRANLARVDSGQIDEAAMHAAIRDFEAIESYEDARKRIDAETLRVAEACTPSLDGRGGDG